MASLRPSHDALARMRNERRAQITINGLNRPDHPLAIKVVAEALMGRETTVLHPSRGSYHDVYKVEFEGMESPAMMRIPITGLVWFREENIYYHAVTAAFLAQNTNIPVPAVIQRSSDTKLVPFVVEEFVSNETTMEDALSISRTYECDLPVLSSALREPDLRKYYKKFAIILRELSRSIFDGIGSLVEVGYSDGSFAVAGRPVTQNMNDLVHFANVPKAIFPRRNQTFRTADEWYVVLAEMHLAHLLFQRNDFIESENDCRTKYTARYLFLELARQGKLSTFGFVEDSWSDQSKLIQPTCSAPCNSCSFRLWNDDMKPDNVLLDPNHDVAAVIDWEFTYVAPTQFSLDPPWSLLLSAPEQWFSGTDGWVRRYEKVLPTFLAAMKEAEEDAGDQASPLSSYMRESWTTGRFWLNYAARKSWAFDEIYWKYLDERFFGPRPPGLQDEELWASRFHLLSNEGQSTMENLVRVKMSQMKDPVLADWEDNVARRSLRAIIR